MKLLNTIIFLISLTITFIACETGPKVEFIATSADTSIQTIKISLRELGKTYKTLEGQYIETEGIVWNEFENVSICPSKDALFSEDKRCFWLASNHKDLSYNDSLMQLASGKTFIIKGKIDTSHTGHLGAYAATIKDIYYIKQK
jgi:hypothetical protein